MQSQVALSSGPDRELSTTSTPLPPVASMMAGAKLASLLEKMWSGSRPKFCTRRSRLALVLQVA